LTSNIKIALTGRLRAGKDTAAGYLALYYDFTPYAFGDELKESFHRAFPNVPGLPKPRNFYQKFGQWAREVMGADIWITHCLGKIERYKSERVLITDLRQLNEYSALREAGYTIIRITAPESLRIKRALDAGDDFTVHDLVHETELNVDSFEVDYRVINAGDTLALTKQLDAIMKELGVTIRA
jgi:dephospho-CoA kinase